MKYTKLILPDNEIMVSDEEIKFNCNYIDDTLQIRKSVFDDKDYWKERKEYKKIAASKNFINKDIPLFEVEDVIDCSKELTEYINNKHTQEECIGFVDGFKKCYNSNKGFSEEQMKDAINKYWRFDNDQQHLSTWHDKQDLLEYINSLKNEEYELLCEETDFRTGQGETIVTPKLTEDGKLIFRKKNESNI